MTFKLLALDMDGTLLTDDKRISEENTKWIKKAESSGVTVMLTTGRGIPNIMPYIEQLQLDSPIVSVNGAEVWRSPSNLLTRFELQNEIITQLKQIAIDLDVWYWAYTTEKLVHKKQWTNENEEANTRYIKFGFSTENQELLVRIDQRLSSISDIEITSSNENNREISKKGITKASGIEAICREQNILLSQCVAVGDSYNDISMIQACGIGVAMENALPEVKMHADFLTTSNEHHGVAKVIQYILKVNASYLTNEKEITNYVKN